MVTARSYHLPLYMDHCEWAFAHFGLKASEWLSTKQHFLQWMKRYVHTEEVIKARVDRAVRNCVYGFYVFPIEDLELHWNLNFGRA